MAIQENIASSRSQYEKILQAHEANTRKYWLVEVIENDCIVTRVGVYDKILPEPEGNPGGGARGISLRLFIVYPSSRNNTVTIKMSGALGSPLHRAQLG